MICAHCQDSLPSDGDYMTCGKCNLGYHYECCGYKKSTGKGKMRKQRMSGSVKNVEL